MGQINIEGLGIVEISGDTPTPEESAAIVKAVESLKKPEATPEASEDQELRTEDPFKKEMEALSSIADKAKTSDPMSMIGNAQVEVGKAQQVSGKIWAKVFENIGTFVPETFLNITKILAPETAESIEQSETGQAVSTFINNLNPVSKEEELAATLVSYMTLVGAGRKVTKDTLELLVNRFGAPKAKKIAIEMNKQMGGKARDLQSRGQRVLIGTGTATGTAATSIAADVSLRPEDLILSAELVDNFPETFDYIAREVPFGDSFVKLANELRIADTDSERTKVLKQYGDAALLELPLNAVVQSIFMFAKYGPKATMEAAKTGAKTKLGKRIASGLRPVTETVANINTRTGRILTSRAALPRIGDDDEMMQAAISLQNSRKYFETQVTFRLKELQRAQKRYGVSDDAFKSYFNTGKGDINPNVKELVDDFKVLINQNEAEIAKILGYKDGNFGVRSDGQDFYVTRQYSSALSPKDNKRMKEAILAYENKKTISDASLENRINGVIKLIDPEDELSRSQRANVMYNIIENMRGTEGSWHRSLFDGVSDRHARSVAEANAKSLLARKDLPEEFRAFLGQVDDPYKGIQSTVLAQGQVLSQLRYYKDIQRIASQTKGKEFELPGLVPFLPSRKETFKEGAGAGDKYLSELMRDAMGKFGGVNNKRILEDPAVGEYFARMISRGLDVYDFSKSGLGMKTLSKISSFGQATQTILDAPAYLLNTSGMLQMMVANGHGFNPKNYVRAISEINTLAQQVIKKDARAIETLSTLKRLGVIDQDVTGEMIAQNARIFGDKQGNIASRAFSKTMEKAGRLYGQPDLYGKLVAFQSEVAAQRAMFPNLSAKQINERAANIVRDTMPTYGAAPAAFRAFSRFPLAGNYTLFPVELVRTTKNVAKYGVRDLQEGLRTGNMRQAATGLRRLAGLSAVAIGMDQLFTQSRNTYGITDEHRKVMATLRPDWSAGSEDVYMEPVHIDELGAEAITPETVKSQFPEDDWPDIKERLGYKGNYKQFIAQRVKEQKENYKPFIRTRTLNSAAFNTFDQIVRPIKLLTGRIFGGETLSEEELEDPLGRALDVAFGQFVSPKIAVQAGMNVLTGVDNRTGKPVYENYAGITTKEKIENALETIFKPFAAGGSYKIYDDYVKTQTAEELLGLGRAERANGRPMSMKDLIFWGSTGSRPQTRNVTLEMGYSLYQDMLPLTASKQRLQNEIRQLEPRLLTEEKMNEFAELYKDSQERSRQAMRKLSRKVENFASMPVQVIRRRNGKKVVDQEKVGIPRVLEAATRSFTANANPRLIESLQASLAQLDETVKNQKDRFDIRYIPDDVFTDSFIDELLRKRFTMDQIADLGERIGAIRIEQASRPLYQDPPEEAK